MFSVLRVLPRTSELDSTKDLEAKMNHIRPGVCAPMRRAGGGFSCEICDDLRWTHHKHELMRFLDEFVSVTSRFSAPNRVRGDGCRGLRSGLGERRQLAEHVQ